MYIAMANPKRQAFSKPRGIGLHSLQPTADPKVPSLRGMTKDLFTWPIGRLNEDFTTDKEDMDQGILKNLHSQYILCITCPVIRPLRSAY